MTEGNQEKKPSPFDSSPEGILARFEERKRWRESEKGKEVRRRAKAEGIIKNEIGGKSNLLESVEEKPPTQELERLINDLANSIFQLERRLAAGHQIDNEMLQLQKEQLEMWVGGGYDAFVSAEDAQVAIDPRLFETQPPAWYRRLDDRWQEIIRARIAILMGCYPKRARGHLDLGIMVENADVRIERDALDFMWREMPGFRIALATMINDLFEIREEIPPGLSKEKNNAVFLMVLKEEARKEGGILDRFADYKKELISRLKQYFEKNPDLLIKKGEGIPQFSPENAARGAVAVAWNLLFLGNAVDSGDQGDLGYLDRVPPEVSGEELKINPAKGRKVTNPIVYAEQARAMMLPFDKAWSKFYREMEKVGTEETWLGRLGDYVAERMRHDPEFRRKFFRREIRIIPQRLFASWFDLITFKDKDEASLGRKLVEAPKKNIDEGLCDFSNPEELDFSKISSSELWGGYADIWDSARKIYEMIGGKNPLKMENVFEWRQILATALSKLRNTPLAPYYKDPEILVSCLAGAVGLVDFSSKYILFLPERIYDTLITLALDDDRLFTGMPKGARKYVFEKLNAFDHYSLIDFLRSVFPFRRGLLRAKRAQKAAQLRAE
ncbi:MAG: hypothetical protein ACPLKP_02700 [Microgenomates group bacterium]